MEDSLCIQYLKDLYLNLKHQKKSIKQLRCKQLKYSLLIQADGDDDDAQRIQEEEKYGLGRN